MGLYQSRRASLFWGAEQPSITNQFHVDSPGYGYEKTSFKKKETQRFNPKKKKKKNCFVVRLDEKPKTDRVAATSLQSFKKFSPQISQQAIGDQMIPLKSP